MTYEDILRSKPHNPRYLQRYVDFIRSRAPSTGPVEKHHICPKAKSLFPEYKSFSANPWNRIDLTPREHYIAHLLLWKAYGGSQAIAISRMIHASKIEVKSSRIYEQVRADHANEISRLHRGRPKPPRSAEHIKNLSKPRVKRWSEESKEKARLAKVGKPFSEEHRKNIAQSRMGKTHSEDAKKNMAKAQLGSKASEETKAKMRESQRLAWERRRAAKLNDGH